jgi:endonuclease YncB( thermonuclease family)
MALGKKYAVAAKLSAALVLLGAVTVLCADLPARAEPEAIVHSSADGPSILSMRVIDGDTIENTASGIRYRLQNVEAASDSDQSACASERDEALRATAAAEQLIGRARTLAIAPTGRSDAAGQPLVFVSLDGRDLGELLMAQGAVRPARTPTASWCDAAGDLLL